MAHAEVGELADLADERVGILAGRQSQTRAERERFQVTAHRAARGRQIREPGLHLRRARKGGVPAVTELGDAPEGARRVAADPDRDGALRGLRRHAERLEAHELAPVAHALVAPARLHDADRLVTPGPAPRVGHAEELDLLLHPADAGAQDDAARRQVVERRQHLRGEDRMAMGQNQHGRAEPDALGHARDESQRDQGLQEAGGRGQRKVAGRVIGIARRDRVRNDDMVAGPERVVAESLHTPRELPQHVARGGGAVDGQVTTDLHDQSSP